MRLDPSEIVAHQVGHGDGDFVGGLSMSGICRSAVNEELNRG